MIIEIGVLLLLVPLVPAPPADGQTRTLFEIFNSPSLNTTLWNFGYPWGAYYNHRANTLPRQVKVTPEGLLNIVASGERSTGLTIWTEFGQTELEFTSGAVNTNGKFCIKNGYVEVSLRAADTTSTWPTVFLVPEDQGRVPMITVMEVFNERSLYSYGFKYTNEHGTIEDVTKLAMNRSTSDGFHRFGVDWGYDQITWYYDDQWIDTITKSKELLQVDRMCLVIGLGVGGKSKDTPIDPRGYPSTMSVDLVGIWQPNYDGFYKFQNVQTGFLMEIDSGSHIYGTGVSQRPDNGDDWQKWHVQYAGHGQYRLIAAHSRLALDSPNSDTRNGTQLIQWGYLAGNNQLWKIQEVQGSPDVVQIVNVNTLVSSSAGKLVSVPANSTGAAAQLELWQDVDSPLQKWKMIRL